MVDSHSIQKPIGLALKLVAFGELLLKSGDLIVGLLQQLSVLSFERTVLVSSSGELLLEKCEGIIQLFIF